MKTTTILATLLLATGLSTARANDLRTARGTVLIAAPTALNGPTNQGIWFINPQTKMLSVNLPMLDMNHVYEGWVVNEATGKKVSSGLFREMGATDSDAAGRYAGPLALNYPPLPGSDYVTLGEDLADGFHKVVVTVEPYPDSDPNPSGVAVLAVSIPAGTTAGTELTLTNVAR